MSADTLMETADDWTAAWSDALDQFEMSLADAEKVITTGHLIDSASESASLAWAAPTNLGPLPGSLQARAVAILDRQLAVAAQLVEAARTTRQHMAAVASQDTRSASTPVYIDTVG